MVLRGERIYSLLVHLCPDCKSSLCELGYHLHCRKCNETFFSAILSKEYRNHFPKESAHFSFWEMSDCCLRVIDHLKNKPTVENSSKTLTEALSKLKTLK